MSERVGQLTTNSALIFELLFDEVFQREEQVAMRKDSLQGWSILGRGRQKKSRLTWELKAKVGSSEDRKQEEQSSGWLSAMTDDSDEWCK